MNKRVWVAAATLWLSACGGSQDTRVPVALGSLVVPASAPWLQVEQQPMDVQVRGVDPAVTLNPAPPVSDVLQARLRHALAPVYTTDLVVSCDQVSAEIRVDTDATPAQATLELRTHCAITARGVSSVHDYHVSPSMPAPSSGAYGPVLAALLATGSDQIAQQLGADVQATAAGH